MLFAKYGEFDSAAEINNIQLQSVFFPESEKRAHSLFKVSVRTAVYYGGNRFL